MIVLEFIQESCKELLKELLYYIIYLKCFKAFDNFMYKIALFCIMPLKNKLNRRIPQYVL